MVNTESYRPRLFGIAYRMLGAVQDAEDTVQDAMLRWQQADRAVIREPEAWLVSVVTRLAIDRLRHAATERETYPGPWLPEPAADDRCSPDLHSELASDLSMAFLVLLERSAPEERAAFLLREVFDADYFVAALEADDKAELLAVGVETKWLHPFVYRIERVNGEPALIAYHDGSVFAATFCETDGERITALYRVMNPDKLTRVALPVRVDPVRDQRERGG